MFMRRRHCCWEMHTDRLVQPVRDQCVEITHTGSQPWPTSTGGLAPGPGAGSLQSTSVDPVSTGPRRQGGWLGFQPATNQTFTRTVWFLAMVRITNRQRRRLIGRVYSRHINQRPCDFLIGTPERPYLLRWFIVRKGRFWNGLSSVQRHRLLNMDEPDGGKSVGRLSWNAYIHIFMRSDDDRALHDHPWPWMTCILDGSYWEHIPLHRSDPAGPTRCIKRNPGDVVFRPWAPTPHCVELVDEQPVTTIFITGPKLRDWGFWCKQGWRHWQDFMASDDGISSRGCED